MVRTLGSNTQMPERLRVEVVENVNGMADVGQMRAAQFRGGGASDFDEWDRRCRHILIRDIATGALAAYVRILLIDGPDHLAQCYSARRYGLDRLTRHSAPMLEVGRLCIDPAHRLDIDVLRMLWAAITREVDAHGVGLMFGCASFYGTDPSVHAAAFAHLLSHAVPVRRARNDGNARMSLGAAAGQAVGSPYGLPPLLRSYLSMGGWVSDHLVIDHDLGTLHVLAGLEVTAVSAARAQALRRWAG